MQRMRHADQISERVAAARANDHSVGQKGSRREHRADVAIGVNRTEARLFGADKAFRRCLDNTQLIADQATAVR